MDPGGGKMSLDKAAAEEIPFELRPEGREPFK